MTHNHHQPIQSLLMLALLLAASIEAYAAGPTGYLNDTGQDTCSYNGTSLVACATANSGDATAYPRQDGRFGRDAKAAAGTLTKTGAGAKAFDFTRVCFNGDLAGSGTCTGALVANATAVATGSPATDWACTKDNVTNLIWSLESGNGGWWDYANSTFPTATNAATRCGYNTGWRLPTRHELLSIVHYGTDSPAIDSAYFPSTQILWYWSADANALDPLRNWAVDFASGGADYWPNTSSMAVRLVRSGP